MMSFIILLLPSSLFHIYVWIDLLHPHPKLKLLPSFPSRDLENQRPAAESNEIQQKPAELGRQVGARL